MTAHVDGSESVADVAERLMADYDGIVPSERVASVVVEAAGDLRGQVPPGAQAEVLVTAVYISASYCIFGIFGGSSSA